MGSVRPYETAAGRRYRVSYRTPDRRQTDKRGFRTKRDAELFLASVEVAKARGEFIEDSAGRKTIGELGPEWLAAQQHLKPSAYAPLEGAWRIYVEPRWDRVPVTAVRHSDVQKWVGELIAGTALTTKSKPTALGASSVIRAYGVLAGILDVAVKDRRVATNNARGVNLPRKTGKRHVYLAHTQVETLAKECRDHGTLIRFLCYTGLRWGEVTALRVRDLDMLRRRITVAENAVRVNGRIVVGSPKSHRARVVVFPPFLAEELARQCEGRGRDQLLFGNGLSHLQQPSQHGGWYKSAIARAHAVDNEFPMLTLHDLRHTAASLAISAGANVKAVQRMLGHASAAMTLDVYADLFDEDLDAVANSLNRARQAALA
jgi:integrase